MAEALHRSIDPGRTEWKVRGTTVLLSLASCLEMVVRKRNFGMRTWRVEFALSVTLVYLPHL